MEEAAVVVTAATGALGPVVAYLSTLLRRDGEYKLRRGTRKDIKLIRSKLKSVHSILWVIWEMVDLDAAGKQLRMEAWRLADETNDAIDDFILSLKRSKDGRRYVQAKDQPSPFQDLKGRAVLVSERCRGKWKTETSHTSFSCLFSRTKSTVYDSGPAKWPTRANDPYVRKDISELVEMYKRPMDQIIYHLVEEENTPELKMASILGAAGMGKTTLARLVFEAIQDKFKARAFVSVTSCHNMTEVLESILQQVNPDCTVAGTKASTKNKHLIDAISSFLKDKSYLVIIDDIWHSGEWETVKESLPDNNLFSRIVTTSRVTAITNKWREDFDALVHRIDYDYSIAFQMNADMIGSFDCMKMFGDMPLGVACMISAMAKERERQEQQETCNLQDMIEKVWTNGIQNTPGFEALVESLELGYNHLPHHMLKTCLLYCSIYPEDHYLFGDQLVRRWMTQGFVCKEDVAKDYYMELVSRGFITGSKLHPMMRNYLRCKLREHNFITCSSDIPSSPVSGRLYIDDLSVDILSRINDLHHIRSLVVLKNAERVPYKHLQHLRVLEVQGSEALENKHLKDMCGLLRLRHLLVSSGNLLNRERFGINEMPAEIARLQYLETLNVGGTGIRRLPAEIGDLKQLKTLDVSRNSELTELPMETGNLQHILESLIISGANIREQAWEIIGTLKNLRTLDVSDNRELSGIPGDIGELLHLETLDLHGTGITELPREIGKLLHLETMDLHQTGITELPREIGKLLHLETMDLHQTGITELPREIGKLLHLENLDLHQTLITELPREIGDLKQLEALNLSGVETITKLPREIGKLQQLKVLNVNGTKVKKIPREIGGLKKLKNLDAEIGTLPFEAGQLPKLEGVPKCVQTAWKKSDLVSSLAREILSFQTTNGSTGDGGRLVVGTKHMHIPQWIENHFNNISFLDIRICTLEERDLKILRDMPYLGSLTLRFEAVPRKPIAISSAGFVKLKYLTVDSPVPRVTFQEGAMPYLYDLTFQFQFYGGVPTTEPVGINHLVDLRYVRFRCSKWYREDSSCISAVRKEAQEHPSEVFQVIVSVGDQERVVFERPDIAKTFQSSSESSYGGVSDIDEDLHSILAIDD